MPSFNKFQIFSQNIGRGVHNLNSNTLKVMLTNTAPNAADTVYNGTTSPPQLSGTSNAQEIAAGVGYSAGGGSVPNSSYSQSGGTATLVGDAVVFTASGGSFPSFRYAVLYDSTAGTSSTRPLLGYWDYGSSIALNDGETFSVKPNNASTGGTILTLS